MEKRWLSLDVSHRPRFLVGVYSTNGLRWNRGQGRKIVKDEMDEGLKVHRSVKTRLEAGEAFVSGLYAPKVRPHLPSGKHAPGDLKMVSREPKALPHGEWNVDEPVYWEWVN